MFTYFHAFYSIFLPFLRIWQFKLQMKVLSFTLIYDLNMTLMLFECNMI